MILLIGFILGTSGIIWSTIVFMISVHPKDEYFDGICHHDQINFYGLDNDTFERFRSTVYGIIFNRCIFIPELLVKITIFVIKHGN